MKSRQLESNERASFVNKLNANFCHDNRNKQSLHKKSIKEEEEEMNGGNTEVSLFTFKPTLKNEESYEDITKRIENLIFYFILSLSEEIFVNMLSCIEPESIDEFNRIVYRREYTDKESILLLLVNGTGKKNKLYLVKQPHCDLKLFRK